MHSDESANLQETAVRLNHDPSRRTVVRVIGAGPAGLMAAEVLAQAGVAVDVFDAMPSAGRKFLLAGKGGLNLTHSEPFDVFVTRYGARHAQIAPLLQNFGPASLQAWAKGLGIDTYVGTSGRVFPTDMKAAPLLRAWLQRLRGAGVQFHMRHRWTGWGASGALCFSTPHATVALPATPTILALGGGSWARLGSNGVWVPLLRAQGVPVVPLSPSNCGFDVQSPRLATENATTANGWTPYFASRFAGQPFKSIALSFTDSLGQKFQRKGEFVATEYGVEGSLVYAASALLRNEITRQGHATLLLDLLPDKTSEQVLAEVCHPRGARSLSSHLKSRLHIDGIKAALLHEVLGKEGMAHAAALSRSIKALPLRLVAARPIDEAISSAGGVPFEALDARQMLHNLPGVFCAGEMLDWEAPTGGYLLTACLASGVAAAQGLLASFGPP